MRAYLTAFELDASQAKAPPQKHVGGKWGLLGWPTGNDGDESSPNDKNFSYFQVGQVGDYNEAITGKWG